MPRKAPHRPRTTKVASSLTLSIEKSSTVSIVSKTHYTHAPSQQASYTHSHRSTRPTDTPKPKATTSAAGRTMAATAAAYLCSRGSIDPSSITTSESHDSRRSHHWHPASIRQWIVPVPEDGCHPCPRVNRSSLLPCMHLCSPQLILIILHRFVRKTTHTLPKMCPSIYKSTTPIHSIPAQKH